MGGTRIRASDRLWGGEPGVAGYSAGPDGALRSPSGAHSLAPLPPPRGRARVDPAGTRAPLRRSSRQGRPLPPRHPPDLPPRLALTDYASWIRALPARLLGADPARRTDPLHPARARPPGAAGAHAPLLRRGPPLRQRGRSLEPRGGLRCIGDAILQDRDGWRAGWRRARAQATPPSPPLRPAAELEGAPEPAEPPAAQAPIGGGS